MARTKPHALLSDQLRAVIDRRKLVPFALARAAGVPHTSLNRWLNGEVATITLATADKLAEALGLALVEGRGGMR